MLLSCDGVSYKRDTGEGSLANVELSEENAYIITVVVMVATVVAAATAVVAVAVAVVACSFTTFSGICDLINIH